jgi:outer membrane protein TolC
MIAILGIAYRLGAYLVFIKFRLLKFNLFWQIVVGVVGFFSLLTILYGMNYTQPFSIGTTVSGLTRRASTIPRWKRSWPRLSRTTSTSRLQPPEIVVAANIVTEVRAQMLPIIGVTGSASVTGLYREPGGFLQKTGSSVKNSSNILGAASWELDIWGKIRSQTAAAKQGLAATQSDYEYARMSLAATTAKVWYLATYSQLLQNYAEENIKTSQQQLDIATAQYDTGKGEQQQIDLARAQLAQYQAQLAQYTDSYLQIIRGLEVLLERYPSAELKTARAFAALPPPVPLAFPHSCWSAGPT